MRIRWLVAGGTGLLALAAFAAGLFLARQPEVPLTSSPLPAQAAVERLLAMPLLDAKGAEVKLTRWQGKPLIVNFWATWCPPCLQEMPVFSRLQEKNQNVQFVGIAIDTPQNMQDFAAGNSFSYPLLLGSQDAMSLLPELGNSRGGLPFTLGIDARGQVRHVRLGGLSETETERLIIGLQ